MALASQSDLEKWLQINVTNEPDAAVTMLLENATGIIHAYIDRVLPLTTYTAETYDPPPSSDLYLRQWPIDETANAVVVTENGSALVNGTDYLVYGSEGKLTRISGGGTPRQWRRQNKPQSIVVTYDAGYDLTIDPLLEAEAVVGRDTCTRIAGRVFQASAAYANLPVSASGIKSLSLAGSDSVTYSDIVTEGVTKVAVQLSDTDMAILDPLRRKVLIG